MNINFATRQLVRSSSKGYLSTEFNPKNFVQHKNLSDSTFSYSTYTLTAFDFDVSPILLLSDLSEHTRNIKSKKLCSLMICEEQKMYKFFPKFKNPKSFNIDYEDPMSRPRVTLIGELLVTKKKKHKERFLSRHPASKFYAGFKDMNFYILKIKSAHLVGGFAHVKWFQKKDIICKNFLNFANSEQSIVNHMNESHQDSIDSYVNKLIPNISNTKKGWRITGIDPDGFDLRKKDKITRFCFEKKINDAKKLRGTFVHLHKLANEP